MRRLTLTLCASALMSAPLAAQDIITTLAGGGPADNVPATNINLPLTRAIAVDTAGNVFVAVQGSHRVVRIDAATGLATRVAGGGFGGDGGQAADAQLGGEPRGIAFDAVGNLLLADSDGARIRKVDRNTGIITTIAGNGTVGFGGDGGQATAAMLSNPNGLVVRNGFLYIADSNNCRVRRVDLGTGVITTIAGTGICGYNGDNQQATSAQLNFPFALTFDSSGRLFIADWTNNRVRRVDLSTGVITTIVGTGMSGSSGDGGPATSATVTQPAALVFDTAGTLFLADSGNNRVRRVASGIISAQPISTTLSFPSGLAFDLSGRLLIGDTNNNLVRRVIVSTGGSTTIAGNGTSGYSGDGAQATVATLNLPRGVSPSSAQVLTADQFNHRIRRVDLTTGIITTIAGTGIAGFGGDGIAATATRINSPSDVAVDASGTIFIADTSNHRVRRVDPATGVIETVAGTGAAAFSGDGGPAISASLSGPTGIALSSTKLFIADRNNNRIRAVNLSNGTITTVAGTGGFGFSGDGGPATSATMRNPEAVAVAPNGRLFVADRGNHRIRVVDPVTGIITTVAGTGSSGFSGDGGVAVAAALSFPSGVAVDAASHLFIADQGNSRIRRVDLTTGIISTFAGGGPSGSIGDGGPATNARVAAPTAVAVDTLGRVFIGDTSFNRVRMVAPANSPPTANAGTDQTVEATSSSGAAVVLDGSASTDPNGDSLSYQWRNASNAVIGSTAQLSVTVSLGTSTFTLVVDDGHGATASDTTAVTVQDTTGPSIVVVKPSSVTYALNQSILADYSCGDEVSGVQSCLGPVAAGQAIDTATAGAKTFTVIAKDTTLNTSSLTVSYSVAAGVPTISWAPPSDVFYGTALSASQLNATASVAGTFAYLPAAGTVLKPGASQLLRLTFTPNDLVNYTPTTASVSINVLKAPASVTSNAASKTYKNSDPVLTGTLTGFLPTDRVTASYARTAGETVAGSPYTINATLTAPPNLVNPSPLSVGMSHACAVQADGTVECWGEDASGQSTVPPGLTNVVTVSAGGDHTCALKADGSLRCWGSNYYGQSTVPAGLGAVTAIGAGLYHTCAVKSDSTVSCWGYNFNGQTNVPAGLNSVAVLSTGNEHNCALKTDGTITCWGLNADGQTNIPAGLGTAIAVAAGGYHTCAVKVDGTVACWGNNGSTQIMVPAGLSGIKTVSAGWAYSCGVKSDGTLACWGYLGSPPADVGQVIALDAGGWVFACAVKADGTPRCWGYTPEDVPAGLMTATAGSPLDNYDIAYNTANFTIAPRPASVTPAPKSKVYGSVDPTLTGSLSGFVSGDGVTATYSRTAGESVAGSPYTISAALAPAAVLGNYSISYNTANFTITKANATVTVSPYTVTYDGSPHTAGVTSITGVNGETGASVGAVDVSHTSHTAAGTYTTDFWTFTGSNYNDIGATTITDRINKANASATVTPYRVTYDGQPHSATVTSVVGVNGETGAAVGTVNLSGTTHTNAGTYSTDTWSFAGTANYNNIAATTITDTIDKANATVTVTPYSVPYDGQPHSAAITSIVGVNGQTGAAVGTVNVSGTTHTNAGTYTTDSWSFAGTANYNNIGAATITDIINKANASVTVTPYTVTFDAQPHTATVASILGVNGESGATVGTVTLNGTTHTNAGTYATDTWSFTGAGNYNNIAATTITDTISKATSTTTTVGAGPFAYDGTTHTGGSGTVTGAGGLNTTATSLTYTGDQVNAGTYYVAAHYAGDANHDASDGAPVAIFIDKAIPTISVVGYSGVYNGAPHGVTNSSATGVNSQPIAGLVVDSTTYSDVPGGQVHWTFTNVNYADHSGDAAVVITQASSSTAVSCPASVTYNGQAQTVCTAAATGSGGLHQTLTVTYGDNINAGTASANASFAGDGNHTGSSGSQTFAVEKAPLTATAGSGSSTFDGNSHAPSACVFSNSFTGDLVCANNPATVGPGVGTFAVSPVVTGESAANFAVSTIAGSYSITPAASVINLTCPANVTYNGNAQNACTATVTGASGLSQSLTVTYSNNIDAGMATANASYAGDTNHNANSGQTTFIIDKASVTATAGSGVSTYDGFTKSPSACAVIGSYVGDLTCGNNPASVGPGAGSVAISPVVSGSHVSNFNVAAVAGSFTIAPATSTTTIVCPPSVTYTGSPLTPCTASAATAGGPLTPLSVNYANNVNAGTASANTTYAGDVNHASSSDSKTFMIVKANQTITFGALTNKSVNDPPFSVSASGGASGNPVVFTSTTSGVCGVNGATITLIAPGTCSIRASQAGNANYNAASDVTQSFTVQAGTNFTGLFNPWAPPGPGTYNGMTFTSGTVYKINSTLPVKWAYSLDGVLVDSSRANAAQYPVVNIFGPLSNCGELDGSGSDAVVSYTGPGATTTTYDAVTKTWQRNVKLDSWFAADRCYLIQVVDPITNVTSPSFPFKTKK